MRDEPEGEDAERGEVVYVSSGQALPGVELEPLPAGARVVAMFSLIKVEDAAGETSWYTRMTKEYNRNEFLGALLAYTDYVRRDEASGWGSERHEEPDT